MSEPRARTARTRTGTGTGTRGGPARSGARAARARARARTRARPRARAQTPKRAPIATRTLVLFAVLLGLLLTSALPMRRYFDFRHHIAQLHQQERSLDAQRAALEQDRQRLSTPAEVERLAREELGMVRPGEVPFAIVKQGVAKAPAASARRAPAAQPGLFSRWWRAVSKTFGSAF